MLGNMHRRVKAQRERRNAFLKHEKNRAEREARLERTTKPKPKPKPPTKAAE